ncbi:MAG: hypothetical protein IT159_13930, partial [Bryobacterales bacterium]|nr:hypothetical protein [Bryobacterales bacterium]
MACSTQPWPGARSAKSAASRWARWLAPSFSDLLFLAVLFWLAGPSGSAWPALLADGDTGWHVRTGEFILEHGRVPQTDFFSFSKPGAPWFAWEWGSDVLFALLHRAAGLKGVVLMSALVIAGYAWLLLRYAIWRGANPVIAFAASLVAIGSSFTHLLARPHLFTLLGLAASLWLVEADRRAPGPRVWWLIPLTAVWVNLHGGFLALIVCLGLAAAAEGLDRNWRAVRRYALLTAGCAAGSLVNPYGWRLHAHIADYLRNDWIRRTIGEFQPPSFRHESYLYFEILLFAGLAVAALRLARRDWLPALWIGLWAHHALDGARHVPLYAIVAAPLVAEEISLWWARAASSAARGSVPAVLRDVAADAGPAFLRSSAWVPAVAVLLASGWIPQNWPQDFPGVKFPARMLERHGALLAESRLLTFDQWGSYLLYHGYPRQRVFVDGRSDFYGRELGEPYLTMVRAGEGWEALLDRWRFDAILAPSEWALNAALARHPDWRVVDRDKQAVLYRRTQPTAQYFPPMKSLEVGKKHSNDLMKGTDPA